MRMRETGNAGSCKEVSDSVHSKVQVLSTLTCKFASNWQTHDQQKMSRRDLLAELKLNTFCSNLYLSRLCILDLLLFMLNLPLFFKYATVCDNISRMLQCP